MSAGSKEIRNWILVVGARDPHFEQKQSFADAWVSRQHNYARCLTSVCT
jgi:hypothetical protein